MPEAVVRRFPLPQEKSIMSERQRIAERMAAMAYAIEQRTLELQRKMAERDTLWKRLNFETIQDLRTRSAVHQYTARMNTLREGLRTADPDQLVDIEEEIDRMREESKAHRVPEILSVPTQHATVELFGLEREQEPIVEIESYGASLVAVEKRSARNPDGTEKPFQQTQLENAAFLKRQRAAEVGQLGEFGQDVMLVNPVNASAVVGDGSGTYAYSLELVRRSGEALMRILDGLPDTKDREFIQTYIQSRGPEMIAALQDIPDEHDGGATFLGVRFLPLARVLVRVHLGDCEGVVRQQGKEANNFTPPGQKQDVLKNSIRKMPGNPPRMDQWVVEVIPVGSEAAQVYLSSDGIQANTKETLSTMAAKMEQEGVEQVMANIPRGKDDVTCIRINIPAQVE